MSSTNPMQAYVPGPNIVINVIIELKTRRFS